MDKATFYLKLRLKTKAGSQFNLENKSKTFMSRENFIDNLKLFLKTAHISIDELR